MSAVITWTDASGNTVALSLDVGESEGYELGAAVTSHPVETGFNISDGVRPTPPTFNLTGMVTNSPIVVPNTQMGGVTGSVGPVQIALPSGKSFTATALVFSGPFDRVLACDALLQGLVENGTLVSILTTLRQIDNAVVTSYKVDRNATTGNSIPVSLTFQVLRIVSTQSVTVPAPRQRRGRGQNARGGQPATPPATTPPAPPTSVLASWTSPNRSSGS